MEFVTCLLLTVFLQLTNQTVRRSEIVMTASEDVEVGSTIGTLSSSNRGGLEASYLGMIDEDALFKVEKNGKVVVAKPIDLEALCHEMQVCCTYSKPCQLSYTVMVEDPRSEEIGEINLRIRIMDVNDHAPRFRQPNGQVVQVSEKAPIGTLIEIDIAVDGDWSLENQIQRYTFNGSDLQRYFEIDNSDLPRVQLKLREQLDYEKQSIFTGGLEACDRHKCTAAPLTVNVIDVNDNLPFFHPPLEHNITLPEDTPSGNVILRLNATDYDSPPNARMRFEFFGTDDPSVLSNFHLDPSTGVISLARKLQADVQLHYNFKVRVKEIANSNHVGTFDKSIHLNDLQNHDTVSVDIQVEDVNDFAPDIRMYTPPEGSEIWIPENSPPGRIVTMTVTDRDLGNNGRVTCSLDGADGSFELRELVHHIYTLHSLRSFDAEAEPVILVNITCLDNGNPQPKSTHRQFIVRIDDMNEFEPIFMQKEYSAKITENAPNNTFVLQVTAQDKDQSAHFEYSLKGDGEQYFKIDPGTGTITILERDRMSRLDREMTPEVTFFVLVKDGKTDRLRDGKADAQKAIEVVHTAQTVVTVELIDENDNAPSFTDIGPFYLPENYPEHSQVNGHLHAEDPDQGPNGKVKYALQDVWDSVTHMRKNNIFEVDETSGVLRALIPLDREQTAEYTLRVVACDVAPRDTRCTRANVTVSVVDINDNAPEWLFPIVSDEVSAECINITTDAVPDQVIAQLVAHDRDSGQNGKVTYALHDPHNQVVFAVNATTGQVTVANRYYIRLAESVENQSQQPMLQPGVYRLRIRASDMGQPPQFADTWLTIRVIGANSRVFSPQTGLLILLVLVTLIIAISLVAAIACIRRQHSTGCKSRQKIISSPSHTLGYILPPAYPHSDYPAYLKHNGNGPAYMLAKTAGESVCSSDHCEESGDGNHPITDLDVAKFYDAYSHATRSTQGDYQVRFLEVDSAGGMPGNTAAVACWSLPRCEIGSLASPRMRLFGAYHPVAYDTCDSVSMSHTLSKGNAAGLIQSRQGLLKFGQTSGSPEFLYSSHGDAKEVFDFPEASVDRYGVTGPPHISHHHLASSEQFEGGSADSGRGVSEDEPPSVHVIHVNGSSDCFPLSNASTFFCPNSSTLHAPSTFLRNGGDGAVNLQEEDFVSTGECLG